MIHYLEFEFPKFEVVASIAGEILAITSSPVLLNEIGGIGYKPVYYFPVKDVNLEIFLKSDFKSHCYLKGDGNYYSTKIKGELFEEIAWQYKESFPEAKPLEGLIAFNLTKVDIQINK
ncbi:hypothetical protein A9Q84_14325 [Halobacteriovorax marinus]|uniref:DUF427 domain-containing protein n=1 Tax=Halobacteriovorax marinus TaxID=97084 RepID=A0A1Y5FAK9_9BACT|nr:hypothetical protein A9Q84_14325 [Halobacteriovorax marinus]